MKRRTIIGIFFIVVALLKLADLWGIWYIDWLWKHPWPTYFAVFLLLYIGVELIISSYHRYPDQWLLRPLPIGEDGKRICCSVRYGGDKYVYHGESFHGARLNAFCGGIHLDLREAKITEDEEIDARTYLGGIELIVPKEVNVVVKKRNFIGGVSNETYHNVKPNTPCIHIVTSNFLGGVSIKN